MEAGRDSVGARKPGFWSSLWLDLSNQLAAHLSRLRLQRTERYIYASEMRQMTQCEGALHA